MVYLEFKSCKFWLILLINRLVLYYVPFLFVALALSIISGLLTAQADRTYECADVDEGDKDYEDKLNKCSSVNLVKLGLLVVVNLHVCVNAALVVRPIFQRAKLLIQSGIIDGYHNNHSDGHGQKDAIVDDPMYSVTELLAAAAEENAVRNHVDELCTTEGTCNNPNYLVESGGIRFYI